MIDFSQFKSLFALTQYFDNDEVCKQTIIESRWGANEEQDVVCPYCGQHHCTKRTDGRFRCKACKRNFSCLVGTIFQNTNVSLVKWFIAMYLISSHKKGISSCQLARDLEVTQTTAWYMLHKVRSLYAQSDEEAFEGTVECDEVYIGGKEKWKHASMRTPHTQGRSTVTKTSIFGMMERSTYVNEVGEVAPITYVHAFKVERTDRATLIPIIQQFVAEGSTVITDELNAYASLSTLGYTHGVVNHGIAEYVNDDMFTNSIEGFWAHFRRMISGVYHDISDAHLQSYVDEACYRWNTRKWKQNERFIDMFASAIGCIVKWTEIKACEAA